VRGDADAAPIVTGPERPARPDSRTDREGRRSCSPRPTSVRPGGPRTRAAYARARSEPQCPSTPRAGSPSRDRRRRRARTCAPRPPGWPPAERDVPSAAAGRAPAAQQRSRRAVEAGGPGTTTSAPAGRARGSPDGACDSLIRGRRRSEKEGSVSSRNASKTRKRRRTALRAAKPRLPRRGPRAPPPSPRDCPPRAREAAQEAPVCKKKKHKPRPRTGTTPPAPGPATPPVAGPAAPVPPRRRPRMLSTSSRRSRSKRCLRPAGERLPVARRLRTAARPGEGAGALGPREGRSFAQRARAAPRRWTGRRRPTTATALPL
jgi:hypothetical protein